MINLGDVLSHSPVGLNYLMACLSIGLWLVCLPSFIKPMWCGCGVSLLSAWIYSIVNSWFFSQSPFFIDIMLSVLIIKILDFLLAKYQCYDQPLVFPSAIDIIGDNGSRIKKSLGDVTQGDLFTVSDPHLIPLDGEIILGQAQIDESAVLGVNKPKSKQKSCYVYAGSLVISGSIIVKTLRLFSKSLFHLSQQSLKKLNLASLHIVSLRLFWLILPVIMLAGLLINSIYFNAILSPLTILNLMILSLPMGLWLIYTKINEQIKTTLLKLGMLIKQAATLKQLSKINSIYLNKNSLLSPQQMEISDIILTTHHQEHEFLQLAMTAAAQLDHPFATMITEYAKAKHIHALPMTQVDYQSGQNIQIHFEDYYLRLGSEAFMREHQVDLIELQPHIDYHSQLGQSLWFVSLNEQCFGMACISNTWLQSLQKNILALQKKSYCVVLVNEDNELCTSVLANDLGIEHWIGNFCENAVKNSTVPILLIHPQAIQQPPILNLRCNALHLDYPHDIIGLNANLNNLLNLLILARIFQRHRTIALLISIAYESIAATLACYLPNLFSACLIAGIVTFLLSRYGLHEKRL
ncbi:MAG: hypothetical protein KIT27_02125 [Legionellales bacterium]|nr:hypothetical protein [Legionellales bacterium]